MNRSQGLTPFLSRVCQRSGRSIEGFSSHGSAFAFTCRCGLGGRVDAKREGASLPPTLLNTCNTHSIQQPMLTCEDRQTGASCLCSNMFGQKSNLFNQVLQNPSVKTQWILSWHCHLRAHSTPARVHRFSGAPRLTQKKTRQASRSQTFLFAASCSHDFKSGLHGKVSSQVTSHLLLRPHLTQTRNSTIVRMVIRKKKLKGRPAPPNLGHEVGVIR